MNAKKNIYIKNFIFLGGNGGNRGKNKENGAFLGFAMGGKIKTIGGKTKNAPKRIARIQKNKAKTTTKLFFIFFA